MRVERTGTCDCADIKYSYCCEPLSCYACHCTDCQTRSGAAFSLTVIVPLAEINITKGKPEAYLNEKAGTFSICGKCGVHLWGVPHVLPDFAMVRAGTLDDTSWINPVAHIWTKSAQPWIELGENSLKIEGQPEDPMILIERWNQVHDL